MDTMTGISGIKGELGNITEPINKDNKKLKTWQKRK